MAHDENPRIVVPLDIRHELGWTDSIEVDPVVTRFGLIVHVTDIAGTSPGLRISVQWSNDGVVWADVDPEDHLERIEFPGMATVRLFEVKAQFHRIVWRISGCSAFFRFSVSQFDIMVGR